VSGDAPGTGEELHGLARRLRRPENAGVKRVGSPGFGLGFVHSEREKEQLKTWELKEKRSVVKVWGAVFIKRVEKRKREKGLLQERQSSRLYSILCQSVFFLSPNKKVNILH